MCDFISWIDLDGIIYHLNDNDLTTKAGRELIKYCGNNEDLLGHGAIRHYYNLKNRGRDYECTNFSNPNNFPPEIVRDIKLGLFENFDICEDILTKSAWEEYDKIIQSAYEEYNKIIQSAYEEYLKIEQSAYEEYYKIKQSAWEEHDKIKSKTFWSIARNSKNRVKAWK